MKPYKRGFGLVEILIALAVLALALIPLSQLFTGAGRRVSSSRAQMMLRVRAMEGLEIGRSRILRGELPALPGANFQEVSGETILRVEVERPPGLDGAVVLLSRAEDLELSYQVRCVVGAPGVRAPEATP